MGGGGGEEGADDLARAGLGHVWNDVNGLWPRDLANHGFDGGDDFVLDSFCGRNAGLEGDVDDGDAALDFVDGGDAGGFGRFGNRGACGFDFLGAVAVAGGVDDVIYAAADGLVALGPG